MAKAENARKKFLEYPRAALSDIRVAGFKSISSLQKIEIRPLTILAGANSSGKSSMMQPLLLLKQTLEAPYDPGPLELGGPNVRFTNAEQFLSRSQGGRTTEFEVGVAFDVGSAITLRFVKTRGAPLAIKEAQMVMGQERLSLTPDTPSEDIRSRIPESVRVFFEALLVSRKEPNGGEPPAMDWGVVRQRCFLKPRLRLATSEEHLLLSDEMELWSPIADPPVSALLTQELKNVIHVPALRGNPQRTYPVTAVGTTFSGLFHNYVASIIARWQRTSEKAKLKAVFSDVTKVGVSWKVSAKRVTDAEVELRVGRLPRSKRGGSKDLVNIADVGFGVSQVLPVIVALHVATPDHLVYIEQPEIHLHPRAQVRLAEVLCGAVQRGARVIVETHSNLLLRGLQALVAEGKMDGKSIALHWFRRSPKTGATTIDTASLDESGAFNAWPEDLSDVEMQIESRYLNAVEARMSGTEHG